MSLLPTTIQPPSDPIGHADQEGNVLPDKNFWLLLYNICQNVLGIGTGSGGSAAGLPASALTELSALDADAADADAVVLRRPLDSLAKLALQPQDIVVSDSDLPSIYRALLWGHDALQPDPTALAQPVASISPTGSPFTYTAPYAGAVAFTPVSTVAIIRQGTTVSLPNNLAATGAMIPLSRYDSIKVTYSSAPTMTFIPWSSQ